MNSTQLINFNGISCVQLKAGGYSALIAYEIGSNVIRLRDDKNGIEFFRFKDTNTFDDIKQKYGDFLHFIFQTVLLTVSLKRLMRHISFP